MSPVSVVSADGRLVSAPYNGCTRCTMLTELDRFRFVSSCRELARSNRFPLAARNDKAIRTAFWKFITKRYPRAKIEWIAWVPECGYFEIDIKKKHDGPLAREAVAQFFRSLSHRYKYKFTEQRNDYPFL